jgi:hypothetical protein
MSGAWPPYRLLPAEWLCWVLLRSTQPADFFLPCWRGACPVVRRTHQPRSRGKGAREAREGGGHDTTPAQGCNEGATHLFSFLHRETGSLQVRRTSLLPQAALRRTLLPPPPPPLPLQKVLTELILLGSKQRPRNHDQRIARYEVESNPHHQKEPSPEANVIVGQEMVCSAHSYDPAKKR